MQNVIINQKYGKLTIISLYPSYKTINKTTGKQSSKKRYIGICECGEKRIVNKQYLTKSIEPCCTRCAFQKRPQSLKRQDPYIRTYKLLKSSAKSRNKNCTLTFEQFKILTIGDCYYCDTSAKIIKWGREPEILYNGIDRVDNFKGYEIDNCVSCCKDCNAAKMTKTKEEFFKHIQKIYNKWLL